MAAPAWSTATAREAVKKSWAKTGDDPAARRARTAPARRASLRAQLANLKAEGLLDDGDVSGGAA